MVWLFASLLILISVGGSFAETSCIEEELEKCPDHNMRFPKSPEEALEICENVQAFATCKADGRERCGEDDELVRSIRQVTSYLSSTCQEDNPTFKALSSNLECIKQVIDGLDRGLCTDTLSGESKKSLYPHLAPMLKEYHEEKYICYINTFEQACFAIKLGYHCGAEVRDATEDAFENTVVPFGSCTEEFRKELEKPLEVLEAVLVQELELQEAFTEEVNE